MDRRMQEYWERKREGLIVEIQSLETKGQEKPVGDREWKRLDSIARRQLRRLKRQAVATATGNAWKHWRQFGWSHTLSTIWQLRGYIQTNIEPRLMLYVGRHTDTERPFALYEFGLKGHDVKRRVHANGLEEERLSDEKLFLWIDNFKTGHCFCRVYPATNTTPRALDLVQDLGVRLKAKSDISLDGLVPSAFMEHLQTVESLSQMLVESARKDILHWRMTYKLECLKDELQGFDRARAKWDKVYLPTEQKIDLIKQMDMFMKGSASRPQALLLKGPPGTGKTLLAQTMAEVAGSKFYKLSISDIKHPNLGESAQRVARIWKEARANKPAILFLDECESLFGKRGAAETDVIGTDIVQSFLSQWDGKESNLWVMGATNRRDMIDEAILSRFGAEIEIGLPDEDSRRLILEQELRQHGATISVSPEAARQTQGFSGRDLAMLAGRIVAEAHPGDPTQENILRAVRKQRVNGNAGIDTQATWSSLVLAPETMASLQTVCSMLKDAEGWKVNGATLPTGILLSGLPGTGKTQIARTMANESGLSFVAATTADLKANFLGQSANRVKSLFERVRASAPAILFLDEIDILAQDRAVSGNDSIVQEVIGQLLQEIDGIRKSTCEVFVLAATNRPASLDQAILSRFTEQISFPLPDLDGRRRILEILLQPKKVDFDRASACQSLAGMSDGKSGRDLKNWIARAEQKAVQRAVVKGGPKHFILALDDFNAA